MMGGGGSRTARRLRPRAGIVEAADLRRGVRSVVDLLYTPTQ